MFFGSQFIVPKKKNIIVCSSVEKKNATTSQKNIAR
jgi:hypothetical protein